MFRKRFSPLCAKDISVFSVFFREARYFQRGVHSMHGKTSSHSGAGIDLKTDRSIRFTGPHEHSCVHQGYSGLADIWKSSGRFGFRMGK